MSVNLFKSREGMKGFKSNIKMWNTIKLLDFINLTEEEVCCYSELEQLTYQLRGTVCKYKSVVS